MWDRKELKQRGKAAFKANYWKCVLVALLLTLFAAGASTSASRTASTTLNENNYSISLTGQGTEVVVNDQTFENAGDAITAIGTAEGADAQVVADLAEAANTIQSNPEAQKAVGIMLATLGGAILVIGIVGTILGLTAAPWALIASAIATLGFDCRIELEKTDGTIIELFSREVGQKAVDLGSAVVDEVKERIHKD